MKDIILNHLINRSDRKQIRYTLICPSCSKEWISAGFDMEKAAPPDTQKKQAAAEAEANFDICPLCGRLVCSSCMAAVGEMKMCKNCADRMG